MKKKVAAIVGLALTLASVGLVSSAKADYPAVSGLPLMTCSESAPVAIDTTPKSIPTNSKIINLSKSQKSVNITSGKATVIKLKSLPKSAYAEATIKCADEKSSTFLGAVKTDSKGNLQLPAFALFKSGSYTLTVKVGKSSRTIKITVK